MPVQIGQTPDNSFDRPMGLLTDCHRRIEKFLAAQITVVGELHGGALDDRNRDALEKSLRYFANAAPWHTADEEQSLFPRLRELDDPRVNRLLAEVDRLEADHRRAEAQHGEVDEIVRRWIDDDGLEPQQVDRLLHLLQELRATYQRHIAFEDEQVFPLAERVLSARQVQAMGREMAKRRGVDPGMPPRRCRHGRSRAEADDQTATPASGIPAPGIPAPGADTLGAAAPNAPGSAD